MSARHAACEAACAIALLKYFGYKLVMISTLKGLPIATCGQVLCELVPARKQSFPVVVRRRSICPKGLPSVARMRCIDEKKAVEGVLDIVRHADVYGDKGFIGQDWQQQITSSTGNKIWTIHQDNQHYQPSASLKRLIAKVRQRIEGVFHEIQNTGRNPEQPDLWTHLNQRLA